MEGLHGIGDVVLAHPDARVVHTQAQFRADHRSRHDDLSPFPGELDRVGEQLPEEPVDLGLVGVQLGQGVEAQAQAADLLDLDGVTGRVTIDAERWEARAENVIATRGPRSPRVTVIAHVDAKPGTPGAVDNAAGVVTLIDLADRLSPHRGELPVGVDLEYRQVRARI